MVGAGFGGLAAAKRLEREDVDVTVVDRHNFHTFLPLLYQVATAGLNPADVGYVGPRGVPPRAAGAVPQGRGRRRRLGRPHRHARAPRARSPSTT